MLKNGDAYVDQGQDYYEKQYRDRVTKNLRKKAVSLGFDIVPRATDNDLYNTVLSSG